jgi:hypothetical protein
MDDSKIAERCFRENFQLFGSDATQQPEKFNFYNGLVNLASAISGIERSLSSIRQSLGAVEDRLTLLERKIH